MNTKTRILLLITATFALTVVAAVFAQKARQPDKEMWESISRGSVDQDGKHGIFPTAYRTVRLDKAALAQLLTSAPMEFTQDGSLNPIIELPMPDGTLARFRFEESPIIELGLAAKYPDLKTYRAQGVDDPTATSRFDWLPNGFHAIILAPSGTVVINPYAKGNTTDYITYWKKDAGTLAKPFECHLSELGLPELSKQGGAVPDVISGTQLRTYRLALAANHEYTVEIDGANSTIAHVLAAEVQVMNGVNAIFEREVAVHMNIIANNNLITYASDRLCGLVPCTNGNDPYTSCGSALGDNITNLNAVIGAANYDIGHLFNGDFDGQSCGGGQAYLGSVCNDNLKAGARSGDPLPQLPTTVHLVAHEMGHQFSAGHSFNGAEGACSDANRFPLSAYEPGSGITIMGYAGVCGQQNLGILDDSINIFTVKGLEDIVSFTQTGAGNGCASITNTGNIPPAVTGPGNFTIPKQTPFSLTGSTTDVDRSVTSNWEEYDLGLPTSAIPNSDADGNPRPIFRLYPPSAHGGTRMFPSLQYILNNGNVPPPTTGGFLTGEILPAISRVMVFKMVARDNRANGGGVNSVQSSVTIDGAAAPFAVTSPNTAITVSGGGYFTVTWNASGNAANVKISLSTDGGQTFPTVLATSTPNDGAQSVFIPNVGTSAARIKIEAVGNIYFDISNTNFTIITNS